MRPSFSVWAGLALASWALITPGSVAAQQPKPSAAPMVKPGGPGMAAKKLREHAEKRRERRVEAMGPDKKPRRPDDDDGAGKVGKLAKRRLKAAIKQRRDDLREAMGKFKADPERQKKWMERVKAWREETRTSAKEGPDKLKALLKERKAKRNERRDQHRTLMKEMWGPIHELSPVRAELRSHAWRMARLQRLYELAAEKNDEKLLARVEKLMDHERERHQARMQAFSSEIQSEVTGGPAAGADEEPAAKGSDDADEGESE